MTSISKKLFTKNRKSLVDENPSPDKNLFRYQKMLRNHLLAEIVGAAEKLTANRRRTSLDEIRAAGDEIIRAALARAEPVFGAGIAGNLVRAATHEIIFAASDRGVAATTMCACMLARVRFQEQLL